MPQSSMRTSFCLLLLVTTFFSCAQKQNELETTFTFPDSLKEVSGMVRNQDKSFWVLQDSGNANEVYKIDESGKVLHTLQVVNQTNNDWEELTSDKEGNLYIGDFGNNKNTRRNLQILKINHSDLDKTQASASEIIHFTYPEQKDFPPAKTELLYDSEAFILYEDNFYIFTKNRSKGFDGTSLIYKVPNSPGNHKAILIETFKTCGKYSSCAITAAAISPDQKTIILLSHSQIWTLKNFSTQNFFNKNELQVHSLHHDSQKESISFGDNNTLYIADEFKKGIGGKVYKVDLNNLSKN